MKIILKLTGAAFAAACLSSCTITPEQAADLELLHKIYGLTVTVGK